MARLAGGSRAKQGIRTAAGAAVWITIVNSK
ncbi:MAG: hypothetical protein ACI85K_001694 [Hyphomicrobiaceae bacterium]|jgi:hypothetical protein